MIQIIHRSTYKAKRVYEDDGSEFISEFINERCYIGLKTKLNFTELRIMVRCRKERDYLNKIMPGQLYERQFNEFEGQTYTWRMKKELYDIACKYHLFPEI